MTVLPRLRQWSCKRSLLPHRWQGKEEIEWMLLLGIIMVLWKCSLGILQQPTENLYVLRRFTLTRNQRSKIDGYSEIFHCMYECFEPVYIFLTADWVRKLNFEWHCSTWSPLKFGLKSEFSSRSEILHPFDRVVKCVPFSDLLEIILCEDISY